MIKTEVPEHVCAAVNAAMDALAMGDSQDEAWQEAISAYEQATTRIDREREHLMLDYYDVPRCGDVEHRINELGQMYRRALYALASNDSARKSREDELKGP